MTVFQDLPLQVQAMEWSYYAFKRQHVFSVVLVETK